MELYKESLLNKIEDDLTGRNQNWDEIETHLADYDSHLADYDAHLAESAQKHIAESGENANGRYVRFDDGTQICWAEHEENITTTVYDGTNYVVLNTHLWPAPFSATYHPVGAITGDKGEIIGIAQYAWSNSAYAGAVYTRVPFSNNATKIWAFAIGRWK